MRFRLLLAFVGGIVGLAGCDVPPRGPIGTVKIVHVENRGIR